MKLNRMSTKSAFLWNGIGKLGQYAISFGVNILLARLLTPDIFGLVGLLSVFMVISSLLIESGFRDALIRKSEVSEQEYTSVFYLNLAISILVYILLFFLAPLIADFYGRPLLLPVSRAIFLTFVINSLSIVQTIHFEKQLDFKFLSKVNIFSGLLSGLLGIVMAYLNYGVWALISSYLVNTLFRTIALWAFSSWRPMKTYSHTAIKELFGFSYKLLLSGLFAHISANITQLIIGKFYSIAQVGYYDRAVVLQRIPMTTLSDVLNQVSYPLLANNVENRKTLFALLVKFICIVSVPLFLFLIVLAEPIIILLLTKKWLAMVPYFQLLCVTGIMYPISILNSNVLKIYNHSGIILKNGIIRNTLLLIAIFFSYKLGVICMVFTIMLINTLFPFKAFYDLDRLVYKGIFLFYVKTIGTFFILGLCAASIMYFLPLESDSLFLILMIKSIVGVISYIGLTLIFQKTTLMEVLKVVKTKK